MDKETFDKVIEIVTTHDEGDGKYCDTGDDMEWSCRSHCTESAVERLFKAYEAGQI